MRVRIHLAIATIEDVHRACCLSQNPPRPSGISNKESLAMTAKTQGVGIVLAMLCALAPVAPTLAASASESLALLDKTTLNGRLEVIVELYAPPGKDGTADDPERYPAELVFERPDRFSLTIRRGEKKEYRAVAEAGVVRWLDVATGATGKADVAQLIDPLVLALLGTAGELATYASAKDLALPKNSPMRGALLAPHTQAGELATCTVWVGETGEPIGYDFQFFDGRRVFVSVLRQERNIVLSGKEFSL